MRQRVKYSTPGTNAYANRKCSQFLIGIVTPLGFKYNVNFFNISAIKLETPLRIYTRDIFIEISDDVVQPNILIPCV